MFCFLRYVPTFDEQIEEIRSVTVDQLKKFHTGSLTFYGRTMAWDADLQKKVQALSPQQIVEALRRHLDISAMTFVKGGDFKKAGVKP